MYEVISKLRGIASSLDPFTHWNDPSIEKLKAIAKEVDKSWSQSWLGYHSNVYYEDLQPPPPGAHFSKEWGLDHDNMIRYTTGEWIEFNRDQITQHLLDLVGNPDIDSLIEESMKVVDTFTDSLNGALSIIEAGHIRKKDSLCEKISKDIEKTKVITVNDYIQFRRPSGQQMSRDSIAIEKGLIVPPHIEIEAKAFSIEAPYKACRTLQKYLIKLASHLENVQKISIGETQLGSNVFVGHGKSVLWREIKDFMTDRLGLPVDEFNRVPVAGITNVDRLKQMLNQAAIAFLVMTAEDEQTDGAIRARQNVIHEVGLFQGRLGFTKAIVILEEGCEEFSNIQGLGQIRFPKGQVSACYEEIRLVLEREGLLGEGEESVDK